MKVLITGGAGFIGYHLTKKLLKSEYRVDLVENFSRGVQDRDLEELLKNKNVRLIKCDVLDNKQVSSLDTDYDFVYHFAAIIGVHHVLQRPYAVLADNVAMIANMIEHCRKQKALKRFVFASTSEVYAGSLEKLNMPIPTPETTTIALPDLKHPRTSYMFSKLYGEALCYQSGVPFTIIRPHNFYGPRMGLSHVIPELLKKAYFAENDAGIDVFSVEHTRTFCYIDDAIEFIVRATQSDSCIGEALNIGTESPEISMGDLSLKILKTVGKNIKIRPLPATSGSPSRRCPDMKKTNQLTGFVSQVSLEEGIKRTFEWYKANAFDRNEVCAS